VKIVLNGCGLEMNERFEVVQVTNDGETTISLYDSLKNQYYIFDGSKDRLQRLADDINHLIESRNYHKKTRNDALSENEKLWSVVDGFKSLLELEFEGKI